MLHTDRRCGMIRSYGASDHAEKSYGKPAECGIEAVVLRGGCSKYCEQHGRATIVRWPSPRDVAARCSGDVRVRLGDLDAAVSRLASTLSGDDVRGDGGDALGSGSTNLDEPRAEGIVTDKSSRHAERVGSRWSINCRTRRICSVGVAQPSSLTGRLPRRATRRTPTGRYASREV